MESYRSQSALYSESTFHQQHPTLDPPITRDSLSELDADRVLNNILLRHDLNFESNIQYRPITHGARSEERITEAAQYWGAMEIEIDVYLRKKSQYCARHFKTSLHSRRRSSKPLSPYTNILCRLPRMFGAIRDTLKTLVPEDEHEAIDSRLDVELINQQMENGICDFVSLGNCLSNLLQRFCSSERDHLFDKMISRIRLGVLQDDYRLITSGLKTVFSILEIMKLVSSVEKL